MDDGPAPPRTDAPLRAAAACGFLLPAAASLWHILAADVPPSWDDGAYLTVSFALWDRLSSLRLWSFAEGFTQAFGIKAPLLALLPFPVYAAAGKGFAQAAASNLLALGALSLLAWRIGQRLRPPLGGVFAVWLLNLTPLVYGLSRHFYVETLLAALCAAAFCLLLEGGRPVLLGAVLGLGMLCKLTFPVYVGVPLALLAGRGRRPRDLALAGAVAVLAASVWYARNLAAALAFARSAGYGASTLASGGWSVGGALTYLGTVVREGWGWPQALLGAVACLVLLRSARAPGRESVLNAAALAAWTVVPPLFFASGLVPEPRWSGPSVAAASIGLGVLLAASLERVPARTRAAAAAAALLLPAAVFAEQTFGVGVLAPWRGAPRAFVWNGPPEKGGLWAQDKLWAVVAEDAAKTPGMKRVVLGVSHRFFNSATANAFAALHGWPLLFRNFNRYPSAEGALGFIAEFRADYFITLEGLPAGELDATINRHNPAVIEALGSGALPFRQWAEADMPNGSSARVFRRVRR